ncbi:MAG: DEAD/DEAH box helicase [Nitrospirae bacterium]|nr:DEAD/DEAH box helicase [Nitrospirota bacterium]
MLFETPEDTYNAFQKFLKKGEHKKAYRCLEKMLHEFPNDTELLEDIVDLCVFDWKKLDLGKQWLNKLIKIRPSWLDYMLLGHVEADLRNISSARECLKKSKSLQRTQPFLKLKGKEPKEAFTELEEYIKFQEWNELAKKTVESEKLRVKSEKKERVQGVRKRKYGQDQKEEIKDLSEGHDYKPENKELSPWTSSPEKVEIKIPSYGLTVKTAPFKEAMFSPFLNGNISPLKETRMLIDYTQLAIQSGFDELLCLNAINDVEKYWYQTETVKKALKQFHGRALLCDEVGLGKTIEAGMLIKEYLMRGMVKNILILTPSPLVSQWKEEMYAKFGMDFLTTDDFEFMRDPQGFWKNKFIIASINTAKSGRNMPAVIEQFFDLVVVDEAHHLRNRTTLSWKLVNQIRKRFILLLTATPVQNNLLELFNLITLLKPGQFKTEKVFKQEYVMKGNLKAPANKDRLRELLRDVMIRNTRSAIDLKLPRRFATTLRIEPTDAERNIYEGISEYLREQNLKKTMVNLLLREAGSSPYALKHTLLNIENSSASIPPFEKGGEGGILKGSEGRLKTILDAIESLDDICKGKALMELLTKNPDEKKIIFAQYIKSMDYITDLLWRNKIPHATFRGDMPLREKDAAIARFKNEIPVLVSTESGGEGRNMQFCNTLINFDLPWNPMRIEQRIGRLHRIGQSRDVFIFNLSVKETIEDYVIDILDNKINMFEMVIGEIEPILGSLGEDRDFEDIITEIWLKSGDKESLKSGFDTLGSDLVNAKQDYLNAKAVDTEIFGEDYET